MMVQLSSIIGSNIYRKDDRPECRSTRILKLTRLNTNILPSDRRGNRVLLAINSLNICIYISTKVYYVWRNKQRDKIWNNMTEDVSSPCKRFDG